MQKTPASQHNPRQTHSGPCTVVRPCGHELQAKGLPLVCNINCRPAAQITVVYKFGGSSVASAERMMDVAEIVCSFQDQAPVVVLSAMGKASNSRPVSVPSLMSVLGRRQNQPTVKLVSISCSCVAGARRQRTYCCKRAKRPSPAVQTPSPAWRHLGDRTPHQVRQLCCLRPTCEHGNLNGCFSSTLLLKRRKFVMTVASAIQ